MLAANRVRVAIAARAREAIETLAHELCAGGTEAIGVACDATDLPSIEQLRRRVRSELGPVDILLPFAGGFDSFTGIANITEQEWRSILDRNLTSTFLTVHVFVRDMMERGSGSIVTMASNGGRLLDKPLTASYAAAKAGVVQFTRHIAMELGPYGVRANVLAPATVLSERILRISDRESLATTAAMSPLGRVGTPEDCAAAALFLVSDGASWLTGITLDVAGGRVMM